MSSAIRVHIRTADALHGKGDVFSSHSAIRVGQTPECELQLLPHPDLEDSCYAVLLPPSDPSTSWCIVRQDPDADICLNGLPLGMAAPLRENDRISSR